VPPSLFVLDLGPCTGIFGRGLRSPLNPLSATPRALPSPAFILLCDGRFQSPDVCNQGIFSFPCFSAQSCFFFEVFLGAGDFLGPVDHKSSVAAAVRWDFPCEGAATVSCSWICLRPVLSHLPFWISGFSYFLSPEFTCPELAPSPVPVGASRSFWNPVLASGARPGSFSVGPGQTSMSHQRFDVLSSEILIFDRVSVICCKSSSRYDF
jgi:hypothetical protein